MDGKPMPFAMLRTATLGALLLCAAWLAQPAHAQDAADVAGPPRVGRVALSQGALYIAPPDRTQEWAAVGVNHPIATGDNLWIAGEGRAEIDYGGGQFRLGPDSNVHVSRLDDAQLALFIAEGRVIVRWAAHKDQLALTWRETGGPPVVAPSRRGFGSTLLKQTVIGGSARLDFAPDGVRYSLTAPRESA
jgi:hypothetical protein